MVKDDGRSEPKSAIDFVHDRLASGRTMRVLTVVDIFTRDASRWRWIPACRADA